MKPFQLLPNRVPPGIANAVGRTVARAGITANMVSVFGFMGALASAWLVIEEQLIAAGIVFLVFSALDLVDGAVARATGTASPYGAVLDAILDRAGEAAILCAAAWYFGERGEDIQAGFAFAALLGSVAVSYMRARAEVQGQEMRDGLFRRQERVGLIGIGLLFNGLTVVIIVLAVLTNLTALQRFLVLARLLRAADREAAASKP